MMALLGPIERLQLAAPRAPEDGAVGKQLVIPLDMHSDRSSCAGPDSRVLQKLAGE